MNEPAVHAEGATSTHHRESFLFFIQSWLRQEGSWKERRRTLWVSGASALTIKQAAASAHQVCITRRALCSAPTPTICGTSTRPRHHHLRQEDRGTEGTCNTVLGRTGSDSPVRALSTACTVASTMRSSAVCRMEKSARNVVWFLNGFSLG